MDLGFPGAAVDRRRFVHARRVVSHRIIICADGRLLASRTGQARFVPRGRGARAAPAACRLAAGPRAQAGAWEMAVGRFLPWAESRDAAQSVSCIVFNEFQKPISINFV
jgi:hypothetical protein